MNAITLTAEQRRIIGHAGPSLLVEAVAGAGKTTTLAQFAAHRHRQGLPAEAILVLVFTPAAEQVFRQRLREAQAPDGIAVSTYAALAARLLGQWREQGLIDGAARYLDSPQALRPQLFEAIEQAAEAPDADRDYNYDLTHLHAEIVMRQLARLKGTLALRRLEEEDDATLADELDLPRGLLAICRRHERLRRIEPGSFAFQAAHDLVPDALDVLEQFGDQIEPPRYGLIVADEWHDANAAHARLLRRLAGPQTCVVAAGDREQVVHGWHGADPRYMGEAHAELFPGTRQLPLTASFRCGPTLGACAAALTGRPFASSRPGDTPVLLERYDPAAAEACAQQVAARLRALAGGRAAVLADCAVLLHGPDQSIALENQLIRAGIPYAVEGFDSYFQRVEILMLRGLLLIVRKSGEARSLHKAAPVADVRAMVRALGLFAGLRHSEREMAQAERSVADDPDLILDFYRGWLREERDAAQAPPALLRWRRRLAAVCEFLRQQADDWSAGRMLAHAAAELQLADAARRLFVFERDARAVARSIDGFIAHAEATGLPLEGFLDALEAAQRESASLRKRRQRVTLATARDAKGKEWQHVLLPYLADGEFPDPREDGGEERRLFYVAMTRARGALYLYAPEGRPSRFLATLQLDRPPAPPAAAAPADRIYLRVPFAEKDEARRLGARWDGIQRQWWIPPSLARRSFARWLADGEAE
ncbi:hypothetical protein GCM10023144_20770 [Pigmentiphaga soli]|uniref:DNA 3'-5' helicase n=1 Tax=Pigmentiphaga soli TaxID=1007095 RepID=A0ABP8GYC9_9BURK